MSMIRSRWAAVGAAVAVTLGAGGISLTQAAIGTGDKPVYIALDAPCRVIDTRPGNDNIGPKNTPITAGEPNAYEIQITGPNGDCTGNLAVPADAVAVATNVTVIQPNNAASGRSYFTVYPADAALPTTSNLNFLNGQAPTPNKVDVGLSTDGKIKIFNFEGTAHAAVDIFGYYIDHHHDDRYYTKAQANAAFAPHGEIVLRHGTSEMTANAGGGASNVANWGSGTVVSGDGYVNISPTGPASIGGVEYGLKSVEYCIINEVASSAQVDVVTIWSEFPSMDMNDETDRTATGCYTVVANLAGAHAYDVQFGLKNGGLLRFVGVQTTWAPTSEIAAG